MNLNSESTKIMWKKNKSFKTHLIFTVSILSVFFSTIGFVSSSFADEVAANYVVDRQLDNKPLRIFSVDSIKTIKQDPLNLGMGRAKSTYEISMTVEGNLCMNEAVVSQTADLVDKSDFDQHFQLYEGNFRLYSVGSATPRADACASYSKPTAIKVILRKSCWVGSQEQSSFQKDTLILKILTEPDLDEVKIIPKFLYLSCEFGKGWTQEIRDTN